MYLKFLVYDKRVKLIDTFNKINKQVSISIKDLDTNNLTSNVNVDLFSVIHITWHNTNSSNDTIVILTNYWIMEDARKLPTYIYALIRYYLFNLLNFRTIKLWIHIHIQVDILACIELLPEKAYMVGSKQMCREPWLQFLRCIIPTTNITICYILVVTRTHRESIVYFRY